MAANVRPGFFGTWHMKALSKEVIEVIIEDSGPGEVLQRLSDPYWFQALGCVVGLDWQFQNLSLPYFS